MNLFGILGALSGLAGVALGAFGAHALKSRLSPEMLTVFETGVRYQLIHALALVLVALMPADRTQLAGWLFVAGTVLFSGSLVALALTGERWLGAVTPLGGLCFLAGWGALALAFARK